MDYANHPPTVNEIRSDKTGNGSDWTPRDALIALLRDIDSGEIVLSAVFIAGISPASGPNGICPFFSCAASIPVEAMGMLELARDAYLRAGRE